LGKGIFQASRETRKMLDDKVYIKNYSIYYFFPDKLEVNTIVRKPKFSVYNGENFLMIDSDGTVISLAESTALPYIKIPGKFLDIGEKVSDEELFSLNLVFDIQKLYQIKESLLDESKLIIKFESGYTVLMPLISDREVLVGSLILIIDSLKDSDFMSKYDKNVQIIDLRFKNPVLK
jgi:hypothetical protein